MISVVTDAFFDDICAFLYLMAIHEHINIFPTGLGYTRPQTTIDVCHGLKKWSHHLHISRLNNVPYNSYYYNQLTDREALNFGDDVAHEFHLHGHDSKHQLKYDENIIVLGPYNDLAKHVNKHHPHQIFGSFSNIRMSPVDLFSVVNHIGSWF